MQAIHEVDDNDDTIYNVCRHPVCDALMQHCNIICPADAPSLLQCVLKMSHEVKEHVEPARGAEKFILAFVYIYANYV